MPQYNATIAITTHIKQGQFNIKQLNLDKTIDHINEGKYSNIVKYYNHKINALVLNLAAFHDEHSFRLHSFELVVTQLACYDP